MNNQEIEKRLEQVEEIIDKLYEGLEIDWNDKKSRIFKIGFDLSINLGVNIRRMWSDKKYPRYSVEFYQWHSGTNRYIYSSLVHPTVAAKYFPYLQDFIDFHIKKAAEQRKNIQSCIDTFDKNIKYFITNKDGKDILVAPVLNLDGLERTTVASKVKEVYPELCVGKIPPKGEPPPNIEYIIKSKPRFPWIALLPLSALLFILITTLVDSTIINNWIENLSKFAGR